MTRKARRTLSALNERGPRYQRTFIRQWREAKSMTLEVLAARVGVRTGGMTHASLSRIERGLQPYSQPILEAIADELTGGDVASLLVSDPSDPDGIWTVWENAKAAERKMIVDFARRIVNSRK